MVTLQTEMLTRLRDVIRKMVEIRQLDPLLEYAARLVFIDRLTGLWNRRRFNALAAELFRQSASSPLGIAAILLDIDHFKEVNDKFGHAAGDEALRTIARILRDTMGPDILYGRYGGEEFAILLQCSALADAGRLGERLRARVQAQPVLMSGQEIALTISLGVYFTRGSLPNVEVLLNRAEQAMRRAKRHGRNCWVCEEEP
jgi:diguanylate cyclase (GGDEF)-like protein